MTAQAERSAPWSRGDAFALALLIVASAASLAWLVHPFYEASSDTSDTALYILCAKSLLAGEGYSYLGEAFVVRPPGFSVALLPLIAACGVDFAALNLFVSAFGVLVIALLFVWMRPKVGAWPAVACCTALWMNPGLRSFSNQVLSDVPGLALLLLALLVGRWSDAKPSLRRELVLAVVLALGIHVRTAIALLLPAIVLTRGCTRLRAARPMPWPRFMRERLLPFTLVTLALVAPWGLRNLRATPAGAVDQLLLHSYSTAMWHVDPGDPHSARVSISELLARVPDRGARLLAALGSRLQHELAPIGNANDEAADPARRVTRTDYVFGALALLVVLIALLRRRGVLEWTCAALIITALPYFGFQTRLVLPIFVLALAIAAELGFALVTRFAGRGAASITVLVAALLLTAVDFAPRRDFAELERRHRAAVEFCADVERRVPRDARLAAPLGRHYSVLLDRPVWSLWYSMRRAGTDRGAQQALERHAIDFVIVAPFSGVEQMLLPFFRTRFSVEPLAQGGVLARVQR